MTPAPEKPGKRHERAVFWLMIYPLLLIVVLAGGGLYTIFVVAGMIYQWPLYPIWLTLFYLGFRGMGRGILSDANPHAVRDLVVSNVAFTLLVVLPPIFYYFQIIPYVGP